MLIVIILSTTIGVISFGNTSHELLEENTISQKIKVPWFKIVWEVISYAGNEWFDRDPIYKEFDNYQYVSSGTIDFNKVEIGGRASHKVEITDNHRKIDAFAQANWIHFLSKLVISIDDSNGDDVLSRTVSSDRHVYYETEYNSPTGEWKVSYSDEDKTAWDLWLFLWDTDVYSKSYSNIKGPQNVTMIDLKNNKKVMAKTYITKDNIYMEPSINHKNLNLLKNNELINKPLDIDMLSEQIYDKETNRFVYSFKDFNIGDKILFSNNIEKIYFDSNENATFFILKSDNNQSVKWAFIGDLTKNYKIGDKLQLEFEVIEKYSDKNITFETLDFIEDGLGKIKNQLYPDINGYLLQ
ncbi:MAG: hypothetical protein U9N10_05790 [Bacillota bacterium]|nr:hypothetical protein [Bacillota bacterium]